MNDTPLQPAEESFPKIDKAHTFIKGIIESLVFRVLDTHNGGGTERNAKIAHKTDKKKKK